MRQKGQVILLIIFLIVVALAGLMGYFYYRSIDSVGFLGWNLPFIPQQEQFDSSNWKQFTTEDKRISYFYPPDWYLIEEVYVSQYPFNPYYLGNDVANAISVAPITDQLQTSYTNEDWFNEINRAQAGQEISNQYRPLEHAKVAKVDSGKTAGNHSFVLFTTPAQPNTLVAYLKVGSELFQFNLMNYDSMGQQTFKQILQTVTVN